MSRPSRAESLGKVRTLEEGEEETEEEKEVREKMEDEEVE